MSLSLYYTDRATTSNFRMSLVEAEDMSHAAVDALKTAKKAMRKTMGARLRALSEATLMDESVSLVVVWAPVRLAYDVQAPV